jgi:serine/threonine-protein kinase RIM15
MTDTRVPAGTQEGQIAPAARAVEALKQERSGSEPRPGAMERTISEDIRVEREDLKEAAEYTQNVIIDLGLDGLVRWVSPSWQEVVGTAPESVLGKPLADIVVSDSEVFSKATEVMRKDDARSQIVRFSVIVGPSSTLRRKHSRSKDAVSPQPSSPDEDEEEEFALSLEGQGIMVYDRSTGNESHVCFPLLCLNKANS